MEDSEKAKQEGNNFFLKGAYTKAITSYTKAISLLKSKSQENLHNIAIYYSNRAYAFFQINLFQECINDCNQAILNNPTFLKPYYRKASALLSLGNYEESENEMLKGLKECNVVLNNEVEELLNEINTQRNEEMMREKQKKEEIIKNQEKIQKILKTKENQEKNLKESKNQTFNSMKEKFFPIKKEDDFSDYLLKNSAIHIAARDSDLNSLKILLKCGVNINERGNMLITPLHFAAQDGSLEIVKYLIENGANLEAETKLCSTPLSLVCDNGRFEIVRYLIEKGCNVNHKESDKSTPLHYAAETDDDDCNILHILIENNAKLKEKDSDNMTPLDRALECNNCKAVEFLKLCESDKKQALMKFPIIMKKESMNLKKNSINDKKIECFHEMKNILHGEHDSIDLKKLESMVDICLICDTYHRASYKNLKGEKIEIINSECDASKQQKVSSERDYSKMYSMYRLDYLSGSNPYSIWLALIRSHILETWEKRTGFMRVAMKMMIDYYKENKDDWIYDYNNNQFINKCIDLWELFIIKIILKDDVIKHEVDDRIRFLFLLDEKEFNDIIEIYKKNPRAKSQYEHDKKYPIGRSIDLGIFGMENI